MARVCVQAPVFHGSPVTVRGRARYHVKVLLPLSPPRRNWKVTAHPRQTQRLSSSEIYLLRRQQFYP